MSDSKNHSTNETRNELNEGEPINQQKVCSESRQFLSTLPRKFKSLIGTSFIIESEKPQDLIESLGNVLEITDYKTNMASYWFLDTIALHVLRYQKDLDEFYLTVLISWLIGEMTLIRDRKHSREKFFEEMEEIFCMSVTKVSEENRLPYWDEIVHDSGSEASDEEEEELSEEEEEPTRPKSKESTKKYEQKKQTLSGLNKSTALPASIENTASTIPITNVEFSSSRDPFIMLDLIIEATYNMYANELRYYLIYAIFVESLEIKTYDIHFALRMPRPVKLASPKTAPFTIVLRNNLNSGRKPKKPKAADKGTVPVTPPPSLNDEEMLVHKRQFIMPLIEANEALEMLEPQTEET